MIRLKMLHTNTFYLVLISLVTMQDAVHGWKREELKRKIGELWRKENKDTKHGPIVEGCNLCVWGTCTPAIKPVSTVEFDASADVNTLIRAFGKLYVRGRDLASIFTSRSESQRIEIVDRFRIETGASIVFEIKDNFNREYGTLLLALVTPLPQFYAIQLKKTIGNKKLLNENEVNLIALVEMFTSLSPCLIKKFIKSYDELYGENSFTSDIETAFKGHASQFTDHLDVIKTMAKVERDDDTNIFWYRAWKDARRMKTAMETDNWSMTKESFKEIFTQRSIPQLGETIRLYEKLRGKTKEFASLEDDIKSHMGSVKQIYVTIVQIVKNQPLYFASAIEKMLAIYNKLDHEKFIYLIRGRCDIDLGDIKKAYEERYNKKLIMAFGDREESRKDYFKAMSNVLS